MENEGKTLQQSRSEFTSPSSEEPRPTNDRVVDAILKDDSSLVLPSNQDKVEIQSSHSSKHKSQQEEQLPPNLAGPSRVLMASIFEPWHHYTKRKASTGGDQARAKYR